MTLTHDIPSSQGVLNGLKRAKRLVTAQFTPIQRFPVVTYYNHADGSRTYNEHYVSPWFPQKGIPYSSVRRVEKYIGINVSFETFYSALTNPDSVVYTRPITGTGQNVHNHYGIVCSCFVSEVLDFPYRTPCIRIPDLPGIEEVPALPLEGLRLLDIVLHVKKHVAIITDIERDEEGKVRFITVSESVLPLARATRFTPEEFKGYWLDNEFGIYRYAFVDRIPYTPDPFCPIEEDGPLPEAKINRVLMTDYGNKANYRLTEPVVISVFEEGYDTVSLQAPDGTRTEYPVRDGKCTILPGKPGFYKACAVRDGAESDPVEFCVTALLLATDKVTYARGEKMKVRYRNPAGDPVVAWQFNKVSNDRGSGGFYIADPKAEGELELTCPDIEGAAVLYLMAKNAYGVYTSDRIVVKED